MEGDFLFPDLYYKGRPIFLRTQSEIAEMVDGYEAHTAKEGNAVMDYSILPDGVLVIVDMEGGSNTPTQPPETARPGDNKGKGGAE
jgi:hypothetical protein